MVFLAWFKIYEWMVVASLLEETISYLTKRDLNFSFPRKKVRIICYVFLKKDFDKFSVENIPATLKLNVRQ